jgi:hypothetical protein
LVFKNKSFVQLIHNREHFILPEFLHNIDQLHNIVLIIQFVDIHRVFLVLYGLIHQFFNIQVLL